jgi:hypothetical protein
MNFYFLTNDEKIENKLLELRVSKFSKSREELLGHIEITQPNFCRGKDMQNYLFNNIKDTRNTIIFIHGGYKISGLVNFRIMHNNSNNYIKTQGICVPKDENSGTGTALLDLLKVLGKKLQVKQINIHSIEEAKPFYIKNGFTEYDDSDIFYFDLLKGGKTNKLRKTKKIKTKRRMTKKIKKNKYIL